MLKKLDLAVSKLLRILKFKKFMIVHVIGLLAIGILFLIVVAEASVRGEFDIATGTMIALVIVWLALLAFQSFWIKKGAEDRYFYFLF
jgi:hypothetical protein